MSSTGTKAGAVNCEAEPSNNLFVNVDSTSGETKIWNPDTCFSEDDLSVHVKHFIADCIQQCIMGLPSQALAAVIIPFASILGSKTEKESFDNNEKPVSLEEYCKKVWEIHFKELGYWKIRNNFFDGFRRPFGLLVSVSKVSNFQMTWKGRKLKWTDNKITANC